MLVHGFEGIISEFQAAFRHTRPMSRTSSFCYAFTFKPMRTPAVPPRLTFLIPKDCKGLSCGMEALTSALQVIGQLPANLCDRSSDAPTQLAEHGQHTFAKHLKHVYTLPII